MRRPANPAAISGFSMALCSTLIAGGPSAVLPVAGLALVTSTIAMVHVVRGARGTHFAVPGFLISFLYVLGYAFILMSRSPSVL